MSYGVEAEVGLQLLTRGRLGAPALALPEGPPTADVSVSLAGADPISFLWHLATLHPSPTAILSWSSPVLPSPRAVTLTPKAPL